MPEDAKRDVSASAQIPGSEPLPVPQVTPIRKPKQRNVEVRTPDAIVAPPRQNAWPRGALVEKDAGVLAPLETLGKVRLRLRDDTGAPLAYAVFRVVARPAGGDEPVVLADAVADETGYASINLSAVERDRVDDLAVEVAAPSGADSAVLRVPIDRAHFATHRDAGIPHEIAVPREIARAVPRSADTPSPRIDDPDARDVENSPQSFSFATENVDGTCCVEPNAELAARQFFFRQLVRLDAPDLVVGSRAFGNRVDVRGPIPFGDDGGSTYLPQAGEPALGRLNLYRHAWYPAARGLGELLYSLPLAPCEQVKLAVIDWSRDETNTRREELVESERLRHEMHRDRTIEESVAAVLTEEQTGWSSVGGLGLSLSHGEFSIGGGGGGAFSTSTGTRELQESTVQKIADAVVQQSSALRTQRATVVTTSTQQESERVQTRIVHNHNRNHAMTVQYFQVLSHYRVRTELVEERPVVLIPYAVDPAVFDELPDFATFRTAPSRPITRFLDHHSETLRRLTPPRCDEGYEALRRLLHCGDAADYDEPYATGARWRITMSQPWRPGLMLEIETADGQSVELRPRVRPPGLSTVEFESDPVDLATLDRLRVSFDPSAALADLPPALERLRGAAAASALEQLESFVLSRCEIHVRTEPSRFLERSRLYRVAVQVTETTLSAAHPSASLDLTPPHVFVEQSQRRQYRDYCLVRELVAAVHADPMRYLRAVWLAENRDRRAIRLDRFTFNGRPLLDQIENRAVDVFGNMVAFPLLESHRYVPANKPRLIASERLVSVPTQGVFAEVYLSCCNATEVRDVTRTIDPGSSCGLSAPDIAPVAAGSRALQSDLAPTPLAAPVVSIQNAPAAPDPTGLGAGLTALTASNVFRDMSLGAGLLDFVGKTTAGAQQSTREFQQQRAQLAAQLIAAALGLPAPDAAGTATSSPQSASFPGLGGSSGGGSSVSPQLSLRPQTPAPPATLSVPPSPGLQAARSELVRQTPPQKLVDHVGAIQSAVQAGLLTDEQANQATNALFGGDPGSQDVILAAFPTASPLPEPSAVFRMRRAIGHDIQGRKLGVVVSVDNVVEVGSLSAHKYGGSLGETNGIVYTCRGGFVDTAHLRDVADWTAYIAVNAMRLLEKGGDLKLSNEAGKRTITFEPFGAEPSIELCVSLGRRIAYQLSIWHEIRTWFKTSAMSWPERYSSFSPEDLYSNLLGATIGGDALLDSKPYDEAMTSGITGMLTFLGAVPCAETIAALDAVNGRWWDQSKLLPADDFLLRRQFDAGPQVAPWFVTAPGVGCPQPPTPLLLGVDEFFVDATGDAIELSSFYELAIDVDTTLIPPSFRVDGRARITADDFDAMIEKIRADAKAVFGPDADAP